jgi:CheY-like chemotaxis protein
MEDLNGEAGALIVDDDEFNILALQFMLEKLNLISDSAISGKEALKKVMERAKKNAQYQIIFLDIEMPEMNGE